MSILPLKRVLFADKGYMILLDSLCLLISFQEHYKQSDRINQYSNYATVLSADLLVIIIMP